MWVCIVGFGCLGVFRHEWHSKQLGRYIREILRSTRSLVSTFHSVPSESQNSRFFHQIFKNTNYVLVSLANLKIKLFVSSIVDNETFYFLNLFLEIFKSLVAHCVINYIDKSVKSGYSISKKEKNHFKEAIWADWIFLAIW